MQSRCSHLELHVHLASVHYHGAEFVSTSEAIAQLRPGLFYAVLRALHLRAFSAKYANFLLVLPLWVCRKRCQRPRRSSKPDDAKDIEGFSESDPDVTACCRKRVFRI